MNAMSFRLHEVTGRKDDAVGSHSKQYMAGRLVAGAPPGTKVFVLARNRRPELGRLIRGSAAVVNVGEAVADASGSYSAKVELDTKRYGVFGRIPSRTRTKGEAGAL